jgi:hypothetical protein
VTDVGDDHRTMPGRVPGVLYDRMPFHGVFGRTLRFREANPCSDR